MAHHQESQKAIAAIAIESRTIEDISSISGFPQNQLQPL
jgi:hypothetical protein